MGKKKHSAEHIIGKLREAEVLLAQFRRTAEGKTPLTPHSVTVAGPTKSVAMDRTRAYDLTGGAWKEVAPPELAAKARL